MTEIFRPYIKEQLSPNVTDIAILRPPLKVGEEEMNLLADELLRQNFLPLILPREAIEGDDGEFIEDEARFFPTDRFREVGPWIFERSFFRDFHDIFKIARNILPNQDTSQIKERIYTVPGTFCGAQYVYVASKKVFLYSEHAVFPEMHSSPVVAEYQFWQRDFVKVMFGMMRYEGWDIQPVNTEGMYLGSDSDWEEDLDFLVSLFEGSDGMVHAIAASSFTSRVPDIFEVHEISDSEALRGGCNVADCRNGSVLISPHESDAPTTNEILTKFGKAKVIMAPENFLDGGGGPRCSISTFSL